MSVESTFNIREATDKTGELIDLYVCGEEKKILFYHLIGDRLEFLFSVDKEDLKVITEELC